MPVQVRVASVEPIPLAIVRRRAKQSELATIVPHGCGVVWGFVRTHQLKAGRNVAVYLDADITLEVGVEIASEFPEGGEIIRSTTPGGLAATATHFGPYQTMGTTHAEIRQWCGANGYQFSGPSWEIYGHWQPEWDVDASRIRTDVFYQVTS